MIKSSQLMTLRIPSWACSHFETHGDGQICDDCLKNFQRQGNRTRGWDLPPRVAFGRGWFSVGTVHWFGATDETVFPSRAGDRVLAQAVCGGICDVTLTYAPRAGDECGKCVRTLRKLGFAVVSEREREEVSAETKGRRLH